MINIHHTLNHLRLSLCHHIERQNQNQKRGKLILQHAGKLLLQKRIHLNHVIRVGLEKSVKQLKDKIKKYRENSRSFDFTAAIK